MKPDGAVDMAQNFLLLRADGSLESHVQGAGAPPRLDGYSIGVWQTDRPAPHNGELHRDGDELIIVLEGSVIVQYDDGAGIPVGQGQAHIVPRGRWHRVVPQGLCRLLHATPGPNIEFRPQT
jgi:quercetin dioxygenase-like cupin family protein